ncbi:SDR family NAD(P)-dependent oxidoreductase [Cupriavidus alkaliphilus]|uniref:SDR family NAD(P)-dependent oxidoreductase n=1 Tax=Cupriavidus alkaliphilus TaxID=942866 RepID=UPI00339D352C
MPLDRASSPAAPPAGSGRASVLITGAASGIGRMTALSLARRRWHCVAVDADGAGLERLAAAWPTGVPPPTVLIADLTDAQQIRALTHRLPPLDALINNAGMSGGGAEVLDSVDSGAARRLLALNLEGPARVVDACASVLQPGARVVNVASGAGLRAIPWRGLYSASKAGLIAQTRALARARPEWIVSALSPGFVRTELVQRLIDKGHLNPADAVAKIPLGRLAEPEELAQALCFLASAGARPLHGQVLVVDGGSSIYGGSQRLPASCQPTLPPASALALYGQSLSQPAWQALFDRWLRHSGAGTASSAGHYAAVVDGQALDLPAGAMLQSVLDSARCFRQRHAAQASLTLLLPPEPSERPWQQGGDAAAAHMAIATLAIEWGQLGLRINALVLAPDCDPAGLLPLLDYVAGPRAQFLTGQVLRLGEEHAEATP